MKKLQSNRKDNNTELHVVRIHVHVSYFYFCPKHIEAVHKKKLIGLHSFPIQSL